MYIFLFCIFYLCVGNLKFLYACCIQGDNYFEIDVDVGSSSIARLPLLLYLHSHISRLYIVTVLIYLDVLYVVCIGMWWVWLSGTPRL